MTAYTVSNTDGSADYSSASAVRSALNGTTSGHVALFKCGDTFYEGFDSDWGGTDGNNGGAKAYYLNGGVVTEGVSGDKPHFKGDFLGDWAASTTVTGTQYIAPAEGSKNGYWYRSNGSGTTGGSEPTWPTIEGNTVNDNGITWTCFAVSSVYLYSGLLEQGSGDYFEFENLQVSGHRGNGLRGDGGASNRYRLTNMDFHTMSRGGFTWGDSCDDFIADGVTMEDVGKASPDSIGGSGSRKRPGFCTYGKHSNAGDVYEIKNSVFQRSWQENTTSGLGTKNTHDNLFYAVYTGPYMINGQNVNVYNNIILGTTETYYHRFTGYVGYGILIANESPDTNDNGEHSIYCNLIAGTYGMRTGSTPKPDGVDVFYNTLVSHNTFVDNQIGFELGDGNYSGGGNEIKYNIIAHYTAGLNLVSRTSVTGITWDYNCWPSAPGGDIDGVNDVIGDPELVTGSGWQSLSSSTDVDSDDFQLTLTSPAKDAGAVSSITSDYLGNSFASPPSLGAIEYGSSGADTTPPTTPGTPVASNVTQTSMDLTWTASTDASGILKYHLYNGDERWPLYDITTNSTSVTGLTPGATYNWKVRAKDNSSNYNVGDFSGILNIVAGTPADTADPSFSGVTSASEIDSDFVRLSWTQGTDVIDDQADLVYDVYRSTSSGVYDFTTADYTTDSGVAQFEIADLEPGVHYFVVRCRDVSGNQEANTQEQSVTVSRKEQFKAKPRLRVRFS